MLLDHEFFWRSHKILSQNRETDRVSLVPYAGPDPARREDRSATDRLIPLNGTWQFAWFPSPLTVPDELLTGAAVPEGTIEVPLNWQFAGFGKIHYTDEAYPFPINPPSIPLQNETGVYVRDVVLTGEQLGGSRRIFLNFEGVESAFAVWVNGRTAGFNQGSRMHSEFDITALVHEGSNRIIVQVMQYSSATYLEDQDQWWLGGIIRDVYLLIRPERYIRNFNIDTDWAEDTGRLKLRADLTSASARLKVELFEAGDNAAALASAWFSGPELELVIPQAKAWTAETPYLYQLVLTLLADDGQVLESVAQPAGFRRLEIRDGVLFWNGRRIFLKGVNRHEFNAAKGRVCSYEQTETELRIIKTAGFNAIRTSHYPNNPYFYDLCDRLGLYVIDEADLETHGFEIEGNPAQLASDPDWEEAYVDRVRRMVERDRNHVSIVLWSLGNESSYGRNFAAMYDWCKAHEPVRPVHYEGDSKCLTADVSSTMYTTIGGLMELDLASSPVRPHILCEFGHAMGNGAGSLADYFASIARAGRIQGAFIWEFKDHGIKRSVRDRDVSVEAEEFLYGGDFGELYHNKNFCLDGILDSRTQAKPPFLELRKTVESLHVTTFDQAQAAYYLQNRFDFLDTSGMCAVVNLYVGDRRFLTQIQELPLILPGQGGEVTLPESVREAMAEAEFLYLDFCRQEDQENVARNFRRCEANTDLADLLPVFGRFGRRLAPTELLLAESGQTPVCEETQSHYLVKTRSLTFAVSKIDGRIQDLKAGNEMLLPAGPGLDLYRAGTDNDVKMQPAWDYFNLHSMVMDVAETSQETRDRELLITVKGRYGAEAKFFGLEVKLTYQITYNDQVRLQISGAFAGKGPDHLPKIGLTSEVSPFFSQVLYDGLGPHENYCDRQASVRPGIWPLPLDDREVYDYPQEYGNRHDVRQVKLTGSSGTLRVSSESGFDLALRPYSDLALRAGQHRFELERTGLWHLHTDYFNSGLGSASCGPERMVPYRVFPLPFTFAIHLDWQP